MAVYRIRAVQVLNPMAISMIAASLVLSVESLPGHSVLRSTPPALAASALAEYHASGPAGRRAPALLAAFSEAQREAGRQQSEAENPKDAAWFGDFSQMESTYTVAGLDADLNHNPELAVRYGREVGRPYPSNMDAKKVMEPAWFHESPSAGAKAAWQSHSLAPGGGLLRSSKARPNPWRYTPKGWVQDYVVSDLTGGHSQAGRVSAQWFDSNLEQYDGFERVMMPAMDDPRSLMASDPTSTSLWQERTVNTSISCAEVGCTATARLSAFDANKEEAQFCKLAISLHATDFDSDYSEEYVHSWLVNNYSVSGKCDPMARGCNKTAWRPLYPCIRDYPIDTIISPVGQILVQGTLSRKVDECPYNGNLLSGVVWVTCLVRNIPTTATTAMDSTSEVTHAVTRLQVETMDPIYAATPLQCADPGCMANSIVAINPLLALYGGSCFMNITLNQTDFDGSLDAPEVVEFIGLEGAGNIATNVRPGRNPCLSEYQGRPLTPEQKRFTVVQNYNVTKEVLAPPVGGLYVKGKISEFVDECATPAGFLLDAWISVRCDPPVGLSASAAANGLAALAVANAAEKATSQRGAALLAPKVGGSISKVSSTVERSLLRHRVAPNARIETQAPQA